MRCVSTPGSRPEQLHGTALGRESNGYGSIQTACLRGARQYGKVSKDLWRYKQKLTTALTLKVFISTFHFFGWNDPVSIPRSMSFLQEDTPKTFDSIDFGDDL